MPATAAPVSQLPSGDDLVVVTAAFPVCAPATLLTYWTDAARLCQWWPPEAEVDARPGGAYHLAWPGQNWHLRGQYTTFEPGRALAFTWRWDHEPDAPTRTVHITFAPLPSGGTQLTLTHAPHGTTPDEQAARQGHLDGWLYFLPRLQALAAL